MADPGDSLKLTFVDNHKWRHQLDVRAFKGIKDIRVKHGIECVRVIHFKGHRSKCKYSSKYSAHTACDRSKSTSCKHRWTKTLINTVCRTNNVM